VSSRDRERRRIGPAAALGTLAAAVLLVALAPTARAVALRPVAELPGTAGPHVQASLLPAVGDPAASATADRRTGQVGAAEQQTILDLHNRYRAAAGVAPLVWDDQLAADAQMWVDALVARGGTLAHSNPADPNDPDTGSAKHEGENLAGGQSAATAPTQWYEEKAAFDAAPNKTGFNAANPDWFNWGHYTQMMWSATTRIGCGTAPGPIFVITSCRYSPPGNFDGELAYPGADTLQVPAVAPAVDPPVDNGVPAPDPAPAQDPAPADAPAPADDATPQDAGPPAGDAPAPDAPDAPDDGGQAGDTPP
jgi:uncharacterized protein YkwD